MANEGMRWSRLVTRAGLCSCWEGLVDPVITSVVEDSRQAGPGSCFVAMRGLQADGHAFVDSAVQAGACAVITEGPVPLPASVPSLRVDSARGVAGRLAAVLYGLDELQQDGRLKLVGVTGTNGKSTSCYLLRAILNAAQCPTAMLGTIQYDLSCRRIEAFMTTPPAATLVGYLAEAVEAGVTHAIMEVSSHALDQGRCDGLRFAVAVFTNLSGDHLDYHHDMPSYLRAKRRLFDGLDRDAMAVVNQEDKAWREMIGKCQARVIRYGICDRETQGPRDGGTERQRGEEGERGRVGKTSGRAAFSRDPQGSVRDVASDDSFSRDPQGSAFPRGPGGFGRGQIPGHESPFADGQVSVPAGGAVTDSCGPDVCARVHEMSEAGTRFELIVRRAVRQAGAAGFESCEVVSPLIGEHNVQNCLAAAAAAAVLGIPLETVASGLASVRCIPGRLQRVEPAGAGSQHARDPGLTVLVDYAHTDDALKNVLSALGPLTRDKGRRLIVMFGCGGDRDRTKRARMARVAARGADRIIVTSDNPRTEDPQGIIEDIMAGFEPEQLQRVHIEPDRRRAIASAIATAERGDVVLLAGKGHENYQEIGRQRRPFDDSAVAAEVLAAMMNDELRIGN